MFLLDGDLCWSASDLTAAARCEYAVLRTLDYKLGRAEPVEATEDLLLEHIARLGDLHEEALLEELQGRTDVRVQQRVEPPYTRPGLLTAAEETRAALEAGPDVVHQAAFFDGEFFGYADFVERTDDGWLVCDAKLARSAKPRALLQLGAYVEQVLRFDVPVAPSVSLLLGNGERADFQVADVLPVFRERRGRLRDLLRDHSDDGDPVVWGDEAVIACGRCPECKHAAEQADDLVLVAGLRMEQRNRLRAAGIMTMSDLAAAAAPPADLATATFEKLRAQARLQWEYSQQGPDAEMRYELTSGAATPLALLPAPSDGDLFFDFEGDPLYLEDDPERPGLEYLWGIMGADRTYRSFWAHDHAEERDAFLAFMDLVADARHHHPDMHIYHYAPYETTALKRLAMRFQTREKELDDLLRSEVFVDLYATVRGSVRISAASYSIKQLEPLYMGAELRSDEDDAVADGGASVVAYHEYRAMRRADPAGAQARLAALEEYNTYDCLSTLRLRDWLLERAAEAGVRDSIVPRDKDERGEELSENDPVFIALMERAGDAPRAKRTAEEQAYAMLANALDYHRRERKQYWWEHYERLHHPVEEWANRRDVYVVESAEVVQDWAEPEGKGTNLRRVLRLVGDWAPGSTPGSKAQVVYGTPCPPGVSGPESAPCGAGWSEKVAPDPVDPRVVLLTESRKPADTFAELPVALVPDAPPDTKAIDAAIKEIATAASTASALPSSAVLDVLVRRPPRLRDGQALPRGGDVQADVVAALLSMDDSYVAIQGPPGTGKSYNGARVIKTLVERYGWRVGVVAQSHSVVENLLGGIVAAGLDPTLVGKNSNDSTTPTWTALKSGVPPRAAFLAEHAETGCVLGGTVWTFANPNLIERDGLDLLVIDEAGQFALAPTLGASVVAKRLLLLGDPQQLPQVRKGTHAEPIGESALGWIMDDHDTIPSHLGYFLAESYRMHPALCAKVSTLSYEGRLESAPAASQRRLESVDPGLAVVTLDHTGNRTESIEEADAVVEQVRAHLGLRWHPGGGEPARGLAQGDVLVVAPYNAQVALIRSRLDKAGLTDVRVGTVDKFQGREAPVSIVSMTASSHGDVPRGMGFLLNRNRINVAVSRAQWRAIVVRSSALTSYMPSSAHGVLELGAFIGLCDGATVTSGDGAAP